MCFDVGLLKVDTQCCLWDFSWGGAILRLLNNVNDNFCVITCQCLNVLYIDSKKVISSYAMKMMNDIYLYYKPTGISKLLVCFLSH